MSTLAFNKEGEPFSFDDRTHELRLRRFRKPGARGTCEAVLDADGEQVYIDVDADYAELRHAVDNVAGFYRLDQCDEDGRPIPDLPAAYVAVETLRNAGVSGDVDALSVVRELAAINAEVAKTMADRFAAVMQSTAEILRAADGAGIAHRKPEPAIAEVEDDDDDGDDDEVAPEPPPPSALESIATILQTVQPMLATVMALYAQIKANTEKSAAQSAAHATPPAAATASASEPASAPPSAAAPSSESVPNGAAAGSSGDGPAPETTSDDKTTRAQTASSTGSAASPKAESATSSAHNTTASAKPTESSSAGSASSATARTTSTARTATGSSTPAAAPTRPTPAAQSSASRPASPTAGAGPAATGVRNGPFVPTMQQISLLTAIRARLTPREAAFAERVVMQMTEEVRAQWLVALSAQSVDEAVETIRKAIASVELAQRNTPTDGKRG